MEIDKDHGAAAEPRAHEYAEALTCALETFGSSGIRAAIDQARLGGAADPADVAAWRAVLERWREERK